MHAQVGLVHAWLGARHPTNARIEADRLTEAALRPGDPNLEALVWEARARVAMAESHWTEAGECMDRVFAVLARFDAPIVAWRIHATASELYRQVGQSEEAVRQRERPRAQITAVAESFAEDEPLRFAMLGATSVRRLCQDVLEMEQ